MIVLIAPIGLGQSAWGLVGDLIDFAVSVEYPRGPGAAGGSHYPSLAEMAAQIVAAADSPIDVVGMSMGGLVAQHVAARYPDRVRSLLVGCCPTEIDPESMTERCAYTRQHGMAAVAAQNMPRWFGDYDESTENRPAVLAVRDTLEQLDVEQFALAQEAMVSHRLSDLPPISVPTTILNGARDPASPLDRVPDLLDQIPGSRAEIVRGGHLPQVEQPDEYRAALQRHFDWAATGERIGAERPVNPADAATIRLTYVRDGEL